jgi:hypothetical protein
VKATGVAINGRAGALAELWRWGLIFVAFIGASFLETLATYGWTETPATVRSSSVEERRDADEPFLGEGAYGFLGRLWQGAGEGERIAGGFGHGVLR